MSRKDHQLTTLETLQTTARVFAELKAYGDREPALSQFAPVLLELEAQAELLAQGVTVIPPLQATPPTTMPSRELAIKVTEIVSKLPIVEDDFDRAMIIPLANLLANLVEGVTGTIFAQFPEVIPHDTVENT